MSNYIPIHPDPLSPVLVDNYLKMFAEALGVLSRNYGALRKDLWNYMVEHFDDKKDCYREFLVAIYQLKNDGKLK